MKKCDNCIYWYTSYTESANEEYCVNMSILDIQENENNDIAKCNGYERESE